MSYEHPIIVERTYNISINKAWNAITNNEEMKKWYFDLAEFKAKVGFEFQFVGGTEAKKYLHLCKVIEVIPGKKIAYSWRYDGYLGNSIVTFELFEEKDKTRLRLSHEGLETFPDDNPDFARTNFVEGWTYIAGTSLKNFLEK
jgi:uncharacterized protein YndB with AHSA1/START domain